MDYATGLKPFKHPDPYDPDEKKFYAVWYRPPAWAASTEYIKNRHLVIPSSANGLMYEAASGGVSGTLEPTWATVEGNTTLDGQVLWKALAYDLLLNTGDTITTSTWTGTNGETLDNDSIVSGIQTKVRLTAVPAGATAATLLNHITVTRANGDIEEFDRSIVVKVKTL